MLDYTTFSFIIKPFIIRISDFHQFSDINISQVSVATHLRCGGIFKYEFVANLRESLIEKILKIS